MNDIFSSSRFFNYIKLYVGENKKKLLQWLLAIGGLMIFAAVIYPIMKGIYAFPSRGEDPMWLKEMSMFWAFLFFLVVSAAASSFISYDSKQKRISALSFPVSTFEKFLTYILIYGVMVYVLYFVCIIFADYLRVWTAPLYAMPGCIIEPMPLKYFFSFGEEFSYRMSSGEIVINQNTLLVCMFAFCGLISLQAFFFLVASIWPKASFRKGFLSLIGISIAFNTILFLSVKLAIKIYGHVWVYRFQDMFEHLDKYVSFESFITSGYIIGIAISLGMYLLAYYRFKEMESIERW